MIKKEGVALFFYFSVENGRRLCYNTKYCVMTLKGEVTMPEKEKESRTWQQNVLLYVHDLMYMLLIVMILFLVAFRVIVVNQSSMFSTLWDGDYLLLVSNLFSGEPKPGDIVVSSKKA